MRAEARTPMRGEMMRNLPIIVLFAMLLSTRLGGRSDHRPGDAAGE